MAGQGDAAADQRIHNFGFNLAVFHVKNPF
jgi:hypothetical protein